MRAGKCLGTMMALLLAGPAAAVSLLNVSYDPTRELYRQINSAFAARWQAQTGQPISINQSHGGSGKQARSVVDGLKADVVTLALARDIDLIADAGLLGKDWASRYPQRSAPYWSPIVFLVRAGNPKRIRDWPDLVKPGVKVIMANPKTSGGARWAFLAAWGDGQRRTGNPAGGRAMLRALVAHIPLLDSSTRGATTSFAERGIGDVLVTFENEARLAQRELGAGRFQLVYPSVSIRAESPVAVVDSVAAAHGTTRQARAYLAFLFSRQGQQIIAAAGYRPVDAAVARRFASQFPVLPLFEIDRNFGGWKRAQKTFFAEGGEFDRAFEAALDE
jgi:sulfate transport system substrate-binding protein